MCIMYIEESFDIIFNIGYGEEDYGSGKSPMDERVNLSLDWHDLVLVTSRPHVISQKVLLEEHCFNLLQTGYTLKDDTDNVYYI